MRREPFAVGSYIHIMKRGARGAPIVRDEEDRWRFLKLLHYLNDSEVPRNWERDITSENIRAGFSRPDHWPEAKPYVSILAFCLLDNHFHILAKEIQEQGTARYMQRLCTSMSLYFNAKYQEKGTLFQSAYQSRTIDSDEYLQYLSAYIQIKNTFELAPSHTMRNFRHLLAWAEGYPFSSLIDYAGRRRSGIIDRALFTELFPSFASFKSFAEDVMMGRHERDDRLLLLEIDNDV